mgnify:CR=1 FL=1|jgi:hypothetical protein
MKLISIVTKYGPISLLDDVDKSNDEMVTELTSLLNSSTITVLKTSESAAVIRPSLVSGIIVKDFEDLDYPEINQMLPTKEDSPPEDIKPENDDEKLEQNDDKSPGEEEVDIIKDMD